MKRLMAIVLLLVSVLLLAACNADPPPAQKDVQTYLQYVADECLSYYREETGFDDLAVEIEFIDYVAEDARGLDDGFVHFIVKETIYSEQLFHAMKEGTLTLETMEVLEEIHFDYEDLTLEGYSLQGYSGLTEPVFVDNEADEYTIEGDCVYKNDLTVPYYAAVADDPSNPTEEYPITPPDKPYVGMSGDLIDMTGLGPHDDVGYNYRKITIDSVTKKHRCTLYYWMDGSRCAFIARVQDDLNEVIHVSENPSGSYFGN